MTTQTGLSIGDKAPSFELPDTDGNTHSLVDGGSATAIVFTCNHCPYALAWHDRILDAERYPRDSFEAMKERVAKEEWPLPYLRDESQDAARAYGAKTTPDVFVLDSNGTLRYRGAPDADYEDPSQSAAWLREALDAVLEGRDPETAETDPVGCSVKWKA